jgi:hypothetical protein
MWHDTPPEQPFGPDLAVCLREAVERYSHDGDAEILTRVLHATCAEAHARQLSVVTVVIALRNTWASVPRPSDMTSQAWARLYLTALRQSLTMYYDPDCASSGQGDSLPVTSS